MDKKVVISVKNLKKSFKLPRERHTTAKQAFLGLFRKKEIVELEVLRGITFNINEGDFFGIVGKNGSGKSTLLKILAGIYETDSGEISINGKISPFLELGVGFNPELSGWDNIYLNGALLGLSKKEIDNKIDEIIEFSELRDYIDQKLKNYSSGMQVRLAFSVAIHAHAPIILLDEVLAVGDANFQRKCQMKFSEMKEAGRTVVLVTHNMSDVKRYCNRAILIDRGQIASAGSPEEVADTYDELSIRQYESNYKKEDIGNLDLEITKIVVGGKTGRVQYGKNIQVDIYLKNNTKETHPFNCSVAIVNNQVRILDLSTYFENEGGVVGPEGERKITLILNNPKLLPGEYYITVGIFGKNIGPYYHLRENASIVRVAGSKKETGIYFMDHDWDID